MKILKSYFLFIFCLTMNISSYASENNKQKETENKKDNIENFIPIADLQKIILEYAYKFGIEKQNFGLPIPVSALSYSTDGKYLASACRSADLVLWNTENYTFSKIIALPIRPIMSSLEYSNNNLAVAHNKGIIILDSNNYKILKELKASSKIDGDFGPIIPIAYSKDYKHFASIENQTINIRETDAYNIIQKLDINQDVIALAYSNTHLAAGLRNGTVKIFDKEDNYNLSHEIEKQAGSILALKYSNNNKNLATISAPGILKVWDVDDKYKLAYSHIIDKSRSVSLAFSYDNKYLAVGSLFNIYIFNPSGRLSQTIVNKSRVNALAFSNVSNDGTSILVAGLFDNAINPDEPYDKLEFEHDGTINIWRN